MRSANTLCLLLVLGTFSGVLYSQRHVSFSVEFILDYSSAEELVEFFAWRHSNIERLISLPGTKLARYTSILLTREQYPLSDFIEHLQDMRAGVLRETDRYGLTPIHQYREEVRSLITQLKKLQLDRRISATLEGYFPRDLRIHSTFYVYFVAFGNERASAVVRRVEWVGSEPLFADDGAPTILVNVARYVGVSTNVLTQAHAVMTTLVHEAFHAVYENVCEYQPDSLKPQTPAEMLLQLVHNEGIAYYITLELELQGNQISKQWFEQTRQAIETLNSVLQELQNPSVSPGRVRELILNANLSGSFSSNYGVAAGQRMAYEIDSRLGRRALAETIKGGFKKFLERYRECIERGADLPVLMTDRLNTKKKAN
ncbi:MAG: hypothetical protein N3A63_08195 [Bacteroidetes bacterium]|nr:hypothetical protein [Bacteroidota bacterium]